MAAGHPRLTFELNAYRQNMPPHWNVAKKKQDDPAYEAKVWLVGRVASAKASLELLTARAGRAAKDEGGTVRWPEFAEYRCYSCHTDLNPGWREVSNEPGRGRGTLPYDTWYSTLLPGWESDLKGGYQTLAAEMAKAKPDPKKVTDAAQPLITKYGAWLDKLNQGTAKPDDLFKHLADSEKQMPRTWEDAMQLALAVHALKKDADKEALKTLLDALAFPKDGEGPKGYAGPAADRAAVKEAFDKLLKK
jgi:hypothetical protein